MKVLDGLHEIEAGALEKLTDHEAHRRYMTHGLRLERW